MILSLIRVRGETETIGKLFINGIFECWTLEDANHEKKIKGETCIPAGSYQIGTRFSPKFTPSYGHNMLWLKDVPNYQYVLIHKGNTVKDTAGCILVGSEVLGDTLLRSKEAYDKLYPKVAASLNAGEKVMLSIIDINNG